MQNRGKTFLLKHRLFRSLHTGEIIDRKMLLFSFPPRWYHDVLVGLDYFQSCQAEKDDRLRDAIDLLIAKRNHDGSWNLQNRHASKKFFEMEVPGKSSRWNTFRAFRVLEWWENN